jgi:hypothetical protein
MNATTSAISSSPKQLMPACLRNCRLASLRVISLEDVAQEIADAFCDLAGMSFQGEVAGVEEADGRARIVSLERLGARRHKERIVLAPHRQKRRPVSAEVFLE